MMKKIIVIGFMHIFFSNILTNILENKPEISTFGDLVIGERTDFVNLQFQYGLPNDYINTLGTVNTTSSMASIESGTATTATSSLSSKHGLIYIPGHSAYAFFTAIFTSPGIANSTQLIGIFDSIDGFAIGYNGATFSILHRNNSSDTFIAQSNFNLDKLDGTGRQGFVFDPTKLNVFKIGFGCLGGATIRFYILFPDGVWIPFHEIRRPNSSTVPSISNPTLPMQVEVTKTNADTTNVILKTASMAAGFVGKRSKATIRNFSTLRENVSVSGGSYTPILSLQAKTTFQSKPNRTNINLIFSVFSNESKNRTRFQLVKNGTLTGSSFSSFNDNSAINIDTSATSISGGNAIFSTLVQSNNSDTVFYKSNQFLISLFANDIITIMTTPKSNATVDLSIGWEEFY
jgi:hypothetical protein